jgi:hypothetical protein
VEDGCDYRKLYRSCPKEISIEFVQLLDVSASHQLDESATCAGGENGDEYE